MESTPANAASPPPSRRPLLLLIAGALLGAALAAAGLITPSSGGALPRDAVALVNGEPIRSEDFARMLQAVASDRRQPLSEEERRRVLERLIEEELLVQRGLELGLARQDRRVRADLTAAVVDSVVNDLSQEEPSAEAIDAFYAANRDFFAGPGRLRLRQVFIRVTMPDDPAALQRAQTAVQRLRAGDEFAAVAADLGDAPLAPLPDAPLPPSKLRDYLGPTALRAALELGDGAISDPVRSGMGYHVLQVVERWPDTVPDLSAVRAEVVTELRRREGERALRTYLESLRGSADVVIAEPLP